MILREGRVIPGLLYLKNFISGQERERILEIVRGNPWCQHLKRKQQYYGIKYFQTKVADYVLQPPLSENHLPLQLLQFVIDKTVQKHGFFKQDHPPNQVLVNQYLRSDRLGFHVEDRTAFGDVIVGISIGSKEYLRLDSLEDPSIEYKLELEDSSCYVLAG
jgi:alkylated DNA repair dioxygenase AlkB